MPKYLVSVIVRTVVECDEKDIEAYSESVSRRIVDRARVDPEEHSLVARGQPVDCFLADYGSVQIFEVEESECE